MELPGRPVTVRFFSTTKRLFGAGEVEVDADRVADVGELLDLVCDTPEKVRGVFSAPGTLRSDITVLVNGRNISFLDGLRTPVTAGDVVAVVPPMAGG
ncbi:MAG: MoaD family protein [Actinobacteria bacterium]|nr:MoaD family protein [Actinomycetota bacterium]